ncbi:flavodoxin [Porphyromonadaceae bacterium COT-184 OH4590]|nr:flavodoxin [Porphyromonadaceae bacterium COT-184 OH4590]
MFSYKISDSLYYVGVNDRKTELFERLVPLPYGVSYNSYLLIDEKVALFDSVEICYAEKTLEKIQNTLGGRNIDYLIIHHLEPDHSSGIQQCLDKYPDIQIICTKKAAEMLQGFYGINANIKTVNEGEEFSLGKHTLKFIFAPMVHWPEVMMTYEISEKILFSADAFGCFGTLDGGVLDNQLNVERYFPEMERYYVNIVGKYGLPVQTVLKKALNYPIETICSLHGPVWQQNIERVVGIYDRLSKQDGEDGVVIVYGSMYSHTEAMAEAIADGALSVTKNVILHDVSKSDISQIITDIFKYKGFVIGSPTYNGAIFPKVQDVVEKIELRGLKNRIFASFGSFTWAGMAVKLLNEFGERMKYEQIGSIEVKHSMKMSDYEAFYNLGKRIALRITED